MNSVSDIYLFSSVSFSVYHEFKSRICNLTFEFILHLYSFFVLFYPPCWRFVLQTEILGKYSSSFRWSKLPNVQMHRKLGFIWKTYAQPAISVIGIPQGPRGCAQRKALESHLFFVQFKDAFISTFPRPDLHWRKYQVLEEKHSLLGSLPQLSTRRTFCDNSVYGNWLRL